jgi:phytoene desaturase
VINERRSGSPPFRRSAFPPFRHFAFFAFPPTNARQRPLRIVVIGSGFGGLAAAIRLRAAGHDVTLLEALDSIGGRARTFRQDGFTFDAGPTIITAPWLFEELFAAAGTRIGDHAQLVPLDPFYNVRFADGSVFRYNGKQEDIVAQVAAFNPSDVAGYLRFSEDAADIFRKAFALIDVPFLRLRDMLRVAPDLLRLKAYRSVASLVERDIQDERLRQVFSFHPLLVGGSPFRTTSIYALIHHLEKQWGVWFAMGGTGALVEALGRVFTSIGGVLRTGARVDRLLIDDAPCRVSGVALASGEAIPADAVVSNADVANTYLRLVPPRFRPSNPDRRILGRAYSMSLFVLYFGTNRRYEHVAHHEILMGPRYRGLLEDIFEHKVLASDFSLYLHRPTATDPSLAPPGCDSWYVLSPVPHLGADIDWRVRARPYRDAIVAHLEQHYLPELSRHIVTERHIDPLYFRDTLDSHLGSAFSLEPTLTQSAWFRPHNVSEDLPNLYFVGAGTHPGAGVPGVLSSAKIVAGLIGEA